MGGWVDEWMGRNVNFNFLAIEKKSLSVGAGKDFLLITIYWR
jgi:hypothetical protein